MFLYVKIDMQGSIEKVYVFPFQNMSCYIDFRYDKKVVAKIVALPQQIFDKKSRFWSVNYHIFAYATLYQDFFLCFLIHLITLLCFIVLILFLLPVMVFKCLKIPNLEYCRIFPFFSIFSIRSIFELSYGYKMT